MNKYFLPSEIATAAISVNTLYYEFKDLHEVFINNNTGKDVALQFNAWLRNEKPKNSNEFTISSLDTEVVESMFLFYEHYSSAFKDIRKSSGKKILFLCAAFDVWQSGASNIALNIFIGCVSNYIHEHGLKRKKVSTPVPSKKIMHARLREAYALIEAEAKRYGDSVPDYLAHINGLEC